MTNGEMGAFTPSVNAVCVEELIPSISGTPMCLAGGSLDLLGHWLGSTILGIVFLSGVCVCVCVSLQLP